MKQKTTEELILDTLERFNLDNVSIKYEKREIDDYHTLLWFIVSAEINQENKKLKLKCLKTFFTKRMFVISKTNTSCIMSKIAFT